MDENLTELVFILDRSGSMLGLEDDTIGGFNGTIQRQRSEPGHAIVSTVLFDHRYELLHDRVPIERISSMTRRQYFTRGSTALLDAVGQTIEDIRRKRKAMPKDLRPAKTIFVIITDGYENSSARYTYEQVRELIADRRRKGWEFLFLGANMDAVCEAAKIGIGKDRAVTYMCDSLGSSIAYDSVGCAMSGIRNSAPDVRIDASWKRTVEKDCAARSGKGRLPHTR